MDINDKIRVTLGTMDDSKNINTFYIALAAYIMPTKKETDTMPLKKVISLFQEDYKKLTSKLSTKRNDILEEGKTLTNFGIRKDSQKVNKKTYSVFESYFTFKEQQESFKDVLKELRDDVKEFTKGVEDLLSSYNFMVQKVKE